MPNSRQICIRYPNKKIIYLMYKQYYLNEITEGRTPFEGYSNEPSESQFYRTWRETMNYVFYREVSRFSICDISANISDRMSLTNGKKELKELKIRKAAHIKIIRAERAEYYEKRGRAIEDLENYISVIINGADQAAYGIPYFCQKSKATDGLKLRYKLYGALVHGRQSYAYAVKMNMPTGVNLTIEVLHRILLDQKEKHGKLPKTLYLQLGNVSSQNKNNYLMAFMSLIVSWKLFEDVQVAFLPKRHTHENIDQMFSHLAVYNRYHNAMTVEELLKKYTLAYQNQSQLLWC